MAQNQVSKARNEPEKPARLQVDPESIPDDDKPPQTGNAFNIWYLRWSGGDSSSNRYTKLKFRVNINKDSGRTKAKGRYPICIFFARGCCYMGKKCPYYHRLPVESDYFVPTQDCFGRDKTADYKDDMNGVGSFNRVNRTLYVGALHSTEKMENVLSRHFQEFGSIENIRVLYSKACAFVTYRLEAEAQFAKEAMQCQSLDGNEVLNIRWANEDPNPEAQRKEKRKLEERAIETVERMLNDVTQREKKRKLPSKQKQDEKPQQEQVRMEPETKALPSNGNMEESTSFFGKSTLEKLFANQRQPLKQKPVEKNISNLLGYSSSEED